MKATYCFMRLLEADTTDGLRLGVISTPSIIIGDKLIPGAPGIEALSKIIDDKLFNKSESDDWWMWMVGSL